MFESPARAQNTTATTAPAEYTPPPSIASDLGLNTPMDFGVIGVLAFAIWKQQEILGVLRHTDGIQTQTLANLKNTLKILRNIVDKHERRLDRLEGKNPNRRKLEDIELDTFNDSDE